MWRGIGMDEYRRYAIYHSPSGELGAFGAAWLGWDSTMGSGVAQPEVPGLDLPSITGTPRRYGFHATLKAPFSLAAGATPKDLRATLRAFGTAYPLVTLPALRLSRLGDFLALTTDPSPPLSALEEAVLRTFEPFRAPLTGEELARRSPERLTSRQRRLLETFGYPYVLDEFTFHMTLTGDLDPPTAAAAEAALGPRLAGLPLAPYRLATLSLLGEDDDGCFRMIETVQLSG